MQYLHGLPSGATAFISWQHWWITWLLKAVYPNAPPFPAHCYSSEWLELPEYTHGACYDLIYQVILRRPTKDGLWHVTALTTMNMGFAGKEDSPCMSSLAPYTNPTSWKQGAAKPGAVGLPPAPFNVMSRCSEWCDPSIALPGKVGCHPPKRCMHGIHPRAACTSVSLPFAV